MHIASWGQTMFGHRHLCLFDDRLQKAVQQSTAACAVPVTTDRVVPRVMTSLTGLACPRSHATAMPTKPTAPRRKTSVWRHRLPVPLPASRDVRRRPATKVSSDSEFYSTTCDEGERGVILSCTDLHHSFHSPFWVIRLFSNSITYAFLSASFHKLITWLLWSAPTIRQ